MKRFFEVFTAAVVAVGGINNCFITPASAENCVSVKVIWTNGSGSTNDETDMQYVDFRNAVRTELERANYVEGVDFDFYETGSETHGGYKYRADGVGWESMERILTTLGAVMSAGTAYNYGSSVTSGVEELKAYTAEVKEKCPNTKFVLGGLSQGGQVTSTVLEYLNADDVIYAATFGDPKLFLPEGLGIFPKACYDETSYSFYREYVPDCYVHDGSLVGRRPYNFDGYEGKLGVWCNWHDAICSSYVNWLDLWDSSLTPHGSYGLQYNADNLYADAAIIIRDKVRESLGETAEMPLNVAILIDTTNSMGSLIDSYKEEAASLADRVINAGGEVSLVEYKDVMFTGYNVTLQPIMHCGLASLSIKKCTQKLIREQMEAFSMTYSGDSEETPLNAAMFALDTMNWTKGARKAIVILTNGGFHSKEPYGERQYISVDDVIRRTKEIDPVAIYTITPSNLVDTYKELTEGTGGKAFTSESEIPMSTKYIIDDESIVRKGVINGASQEEVVSADTMKTIRNVSHVEIPEEEKAYIGYEIDDETIVMVKLNDETIGVTKEKEVILTDVDFQKKNLVKLVAYPDTEGYAGEEVMIDLQLAQGEVSEEDIISQEESLHKIKTPDCGIVPKFE